MENTNHKGTILVVEDNATTMAVLSSLLTEMGLGVIECCTSKEAKAIVEYEEDNIDVIVLDKMLPDGDGVELVSFIHNNQKTRNIPIVMVTGANEPDDVKKGIDAGVFYYLLKPYNDDVLQSVIGSAMNEVQRKHRLKEEIRRHDVSFTLMDRAEFTVQTMDDAENLSCFLAHCFAEQDTALTGLFALLSNAVEHGILEIGYKNKTTMLEQGTWRQDVEKLQNDERYAGRFVHVQMEKNEQETKVIITDNGKGFDWRNYLEIDPARATDNHGRGIAQANKISFDEIIYNDIGNSVTAIARHGTRIKW